MSISTRVSAYLDAQNIDYDTLSHAHSDSSVGSAISAKISPNTIAKAVVLEDHEGHNLMAVLPANHKVSLHKLGDQLDLKLHLVDETQLCKMFHDCALGAVPAIGQAYNMNLVYDETLDQLGDIYLEAGDHETLIHLTNEQFSKLMINARHSRFGREMFH